MILRRGGCGSEFLDQQNQRRADENKPAESSETISEREKRGLTLQEIESLRLGVNDGIGMRETVRGKISGEVVEQLAIALVQGSGMGDENGLMELRAAGQQRGDESNTETAALIAEEIGETGSFVVLAFGQVGIRELAYRDEQRGDT